MHKVVRKPMAVLRNVYTGIQVLAAELYWLAGPDLIHRRKQRSRAKQIERLRLKLLSNDDVRLSNQLAVLEAERGTETSAFSTRRFAFLERLRARSGFTPDDTPTV